MKKKAMLYALLLSLASLKLAGCSNNEEQFEKEIEIEDVLEEDTTDLDIPDVLEVKETEAAVEPKKIEVVEKFG